jgi:hypothetical protein
LRSSFRNKFNVRALWTALCCGKQEVAEYLLDKGADPNLAGEEEEE